MLFARRKWTRTLVNFIWQKEVNTNTGDYYFNEGSANTQLRLLLERRKLAQLLKNFLFAWREWTQTLDNYIWHKEVDTITGESGLTEGSEHNCWRLLFERRKWTQSIEFYLEEVSENNYWRIWFCRKEEDKISGEFGLTGRSENVHWIVLIDRRAWTQSLEKFIWQKVVSTNTGEFGLPGGSEHSHWRD